VSGELFIVSTPIGNLDDITLRAVTVLQTVDLILAEDTRHTGRLLAHINSTVPQMSLHEHNEDSRVDAVVERLCAGQNLALVTDAGTPLISDPGYRLVAAAAAAGVRVTPIPGASSVLAAAVVSGLPMDRFVFEGFLPRKGSARTKRIDAVAQESRTVVVFLSPHHAHNDLLALAAACGPERDAVLCRELTKRFEEVRRGTLETLGQSVADGVRGECVLVIRGVEAAVAAAVSDSELVAMVTAHVHAGLSKRDAIATVAQELALPKRFVYQRVIDG
jgi:16S rRNA (cytidine1402-2'-O)-methyltransferase